jgi:hypothetical protein
MKAQESIQRGKGRQYIGREAGESRQDRARHATWGKARQGKARSSR